MNAIRWDIFREERQQQTVCDRSGNLWWKRVLLIAMTMSRHIKGKSGRLRTFISAPLPLHSLEMALSNTPSSFLLLTQLSKNGAHVMSGVLVRHHSAARLMRRLRVVVGFQSSYVGVGIGISSQNSDTIQ